MGVGSKLTGLEGFSAKTGFGGLRSRPRLQESSQEPN